MVRIATATALVLVGLLGATIDVAAASDSVPPYAPDVDAVVRSAPGHLQVRIYDTTGMPAADQAVARRAASGVLAAAGIEVTWLACGLSKGPAIPQGCGTPLTRDELAVRLVRLARTPSAQGRMSLGYSLVDTSAVAGTLATVYVDRVEWLAAQVGDVKLPIPTSEEGGKAATILGLAIAHELGHLLLGTNAHAAAGLMRAVWSRGELRRHDPADWLFGSVDSLAISQALRHRQVQVAGIR